MTTMMMKIFDYSNLAQVRNAIEKSFVELGECKNDPFMQRSFRPMFGVAFPRDFNDDAD